MLSLQPVERSPSSKSLALSLSWYHDSIPSSNQEDNRATVYSLLSVANCSPHGNGFVRLRHVLNVPHPPSPLLHNMPHLRRQIRVLGPHAVLPLRRRQKLYLGPPKRRIVGVLPLPSRQRKYPLGGFPRGISDGDGESALEERSGDFGERGAELGLH
jgi:hypothetical protein